VVNFELSTIGVRQPGLPVRRAPQSQPELESRHVGVRRPSVHRHGQYFDQTPWSILDTDWRQAKAVWGPKVH
jgi:hypothetical protein